MTDVSATAAGTGVVFEQLVPAALAHRRALAEVFVADTTPVGTEEFLVAVQIPRAHSLWFDRLAGYHDPLSTVEAIRQSLLVVGQRYLGIPADAPSSLQRFDFVVEDLSVYRDDERSPLEGVVRLRPGGNSSARGYYDDVAFEAALTVGGARAMTAGGGGVTFPRETYDEFRRLQQRQRPGAESGPPRDPLSPGEVGRRDPRNVVLARTHSPGGLVLVVDQGHPSFFDHPYDHVPGPLILECFRQAAVVCATAEGLLDSPVAAVVAIEARFTGFGELGADIGCTARYCGGMDFGEIAIDVELHQHGRRIASARVELAPYPDAE
ncbi:AfsA-related hotdog domain-containing protein [Nocardia mexicana]|uniref:A-factor biosynthesis hotdog protein n=1 Tax=Nocardia mexicana TaxID=279262 RepID=A0A370GSM6_9NOCA|nr:AfsA-related hotdog domain-containing protein [Nocardia mexicana]RDI46439.1 A-factor biosynthesis hotdog protein [Nocardia mexicana]